MLKEAIEYLVSLKSNKTYFINGDTYSDHSLTRIAPVVYRPEKTNVTGLDSIVALIHAELEKARALPLFVRVDGPTEVSVFTTYDDQMQRDLLYRAVCDVPGVKTGYMDYESFIIALRSKFIPSDDVNYLLDLLSRINKENGVTTSDNGITQTVEARSGVSLKQTVAINPRVSLAPYRTFLEVYQPESEFVLRLSGDGDIGLFEADGGMWKLSAKKNIVEYFSLALGPEIEKGDVVVMM